MNPVWTQVAVGTYGLSLDLQAASGERLSLPYWKISERLGLPTFEAGDPLPRLGAPLLKDGVLHFNLDGAEQRISLLTPAPLRVFFNSSVLMTCQGPGLGLIEQGALISLGEEIVWVGKSAEVSSCGLDLVDAERIDLGGRLLTPGLVDSHAHPLFAGERAGEFERRARGDHYLDIAREGGGIKATLVPTRQASVEQHVALCTKRVARALSWGTTTMEAKSGYDLRVEGELKLLQAAKMVDALLAVSLTPTLLGAHVLPPEYADDRAGYVQLVAEQMIPRAAKEGLADAVDVYCDEGAFSLDEMRTILESGLRHGLMAKAHIGQFADLGGAELLAEIGARSGDHLEQVSAAGIQAMAAAGVVATMLPGACIQLKMEPPPVAQLRRAGVQMAVASDLNPGTSHSETLTLPMWLACTHYGMTVEEAWLGVTRIAAKAIDRKEVGGIAVGMRADLVVWDAEIAAEVPSHFGVNLVHQVYSGGFCNKVLQGQGCHLVNDRQ